jgi:hypothetical protein
MMWVQKSPGLDALSKSGTSLENKELGSIYSPPPSSIHNARMIDIENYLNPAQQN